MPDITCDCATIVSGSFATASVRAFLEEFPDQDSLYFFDQAVYNNEEYDLPNFDDGPLKPIAHQCRNRYGAMNITPGEKHYYFPLDCKSWKDTYCAKKNKQALFLRFKNSEVKDWAVKTHIILDVADEESDEHITTIFNKMATVYLLRGYYVRKLKSANWFDKDGKKHEPDAVINKRSAIKKDDKKKGIKADRFIHKPNFRCLRVTEFQHKRFLHHGKWFRHIHAIANQYVSKYDIIPIWNHISGGSFNYVEVRSIRAWDNGNYLLKYFTKEQHQNQFKDKERRYGATKGVLKPIKKKLSEDIWYFDKLEIIRELYEQYKLNPERFDANFYKILYLIKYKKDRFIRAAASDTFPINFEGEISIPPMYTSVVFKERKKKIRYNTWVKI